MFDHLLLRTISFQNWTKERNPKKGKPIKKAIYTLYGWRPALITSASMAQLCDDQIMALSNHSSISEIETYRRKMQNKARIKTAQDKFRFWVLGDDYQSTTSSRTYMGYSTQCQMTPGSGIIDFHTEDSKSYMGYSSQCDNDDRTQTLSTPPDWLSSQLSNVTNDTVETTNTGSYQPTQCVHVSKRRTSQRRRRCRHTSMNEDHILESCGINQAIRDDASEHSYETTTTRAAGDTSDDDFQYYDMRTTQTTAADDDRHGEQSEIVNETNGMFKFTCVHIHTSQCLGVICRNFAFRAGWSRTESSDQRSNRKR